MTDNFFLSQFCLVFLYQANIMDNYNYRATVSVTLQQYYDMLIFLIHQREQVFFVAMGER